jgi:PhzF family phenazine biosynthesis protein
VSAIFQIDAFADKLFRGNPAAVCPLTSWIDDTMMQSIALENNLSETAFFVPKGKAEYELRWFTPTAEVDLCGHATLASAHVLFEHIKIPFDQVTFYTKSGPLLVNKIAQGYYAMDFPSDHPYHIHDKELFTKTEKALGFKLLELYQGKDDLLAIVPSQKDLLNLQPHFELIKMLPARGLIVSAESEISDFCSRCFYPQYGINEDPVTGSAHTVLTPYWTVRKRKNWLTAEQLSSRRGTIDCIYKGKRTMLIGSALTFLTGSIPDFY